jgi:hypothetical protein
MIVVGKPNSAVKMSDSDKRILEEEVVLSCSLETASELTYCPMDFSPFAGLKLSHQPRELFAVHVNAHSASRE